MRRLSKLREGTVDRVGAGRTLALGGFSAGLALLVALSIAPVGVGAHAGSLTLKAPFKGGILPATNVQVSSCAKATLTKLFHFSFKTGVGGGAVSDSSRSCPLSQYRLGDYSSAAASQSAEISLAVNVPPGVHNVSANLVVNWSAAVTETNGSASGYCPTNPFSSTSGQFYNGSAWSYYPSVKGPLVFNNSTYWYEYNTVGASGSCTSQSTMYAAISGFMVDWNGTASTSLGPSTTIAGGIVSTDNSTYWSCYNYTLWSYGGWYNHSASCSSSNVTTYSWSYDYGTNSYGTNTSLSSSGSMAISLWGIYNFSITKSWLLFIDPSVSVSCYTYGFPHATAGGAVNLANLGNRITLASITIS
ncbi:MAG: hypothetical protein ACHQ2Y_01905 [Candidatus Lutacidiplasmatales archaeon]